MPNVFGLFIENAERTENCDGFVLKNGRQLCDSRYAYDYQCAEAGDPPPVGAVLRPFPTIVRLILTDFDCFWYIVTEFCIKTDGFCSCGSIRATG